MDAKRYCKVIVLFVCAALALVALLNVLVDPVGAYPRIHLSSFERFRATQFTRISRAELARRGRWEMAIFGTSRPKIGMPSNHPLFTTHRACNLAVDAGRMSEAAAMFDYTRAHNPLRRALVCLDFAMFRASTFYRFDFADSRFNPDLSLFDYHSKNLIGVNVTDRSIQFALDSMGGKFPPVEERNGFAVRAPKPGASQHALFDKTMRSLAYGYAVQYAATNEMQALRELLISSRAHGVELVLAINPVHALDLELLVAGKNWDRFEQWKRDVVAMVAEVGATNALVWDFSGYWSPTTEQVPPAGDTTTRMKFYFENSHFTPAMGALMLDRIFLGATNEFGAVISAANVDAHLQRLRQQREDYARTHVEEIEWAAGISRQALASRKKASEPAGELE